MMLFVVKLLLFQKLDLHKQKASKATLIWLKNTQNMLINQLAQFTAHAHQLLLLMVQMLNIAKPILLNGADTLILPQEEDLTQKVTLKLQLILLVFFNFNLLEQNQQSKPIIPIKNAICKFFQLPQVEQLHQELNLLLKRKLLISKSLLINLSKEEVSTYWKTSRENINVLVSAKPHSSMLQDQ